MTPWLGFGFSLLPILIFVAYVWWVDRKAAKEDAEAEAFMVAQLTALLGMAREVRRYYEQPAREACHLDEDDELAWQRITRGERT